MPEPDNVGGSLSSSRLGNGKSDDTLTSQPTGTSNEYDETNSFNSSSESESFDIADPPEFATYDGLNKKPIDRYEIGLEILKAKIHFGANPNTLTTHGDRSCLMFSVMANDLQFTKELIELGVDVNQSNAFGETALSLAMEMKKDEIVSYLRSKD